MKCHTAKLYQPRTHGMDVLSFKRTFSDSRWHACTHRLIILGKIPNHTRNSCQNVTKSPHTHVEIADFPDEVVNIVLTFCLISINFWLIFQLHFSWQMYDFSGMSFDEMLSDNKIFKLSKFIICIVTYNYHYCWHHTRPTIKGMLTFSHSIVKPEGNKDEVIYAPAFLHCSTLISYHLWIPW